MLRKSFSIWSAFDKEKSPEETVRALAKRGITECELSDEDGAALMARGNDAERIGREFKEYAASFGVSFPQGHLWLRIKLCDGKPETLAALEKEIRLYAAVGVKNAVLHCDALADRENVTDEERIGENAGILRRFAPLCEKLGIRICLENLRHAFTDADTLLAIADRVGSDAIGICLDTGHLNIAHKGTQTEFIRKAGSRLHALHIADNQGETDQHMMPFGKGSVEILDVMQALKEVGYDGLFNYEIPGEGCPEEIRGLKTEYLRKVTDFLFASVGL